MKIFLLSDIHSNYLALENVLERISSQSPDMLVFLGDYVSDCPYPERTIKLLNQAANRYKSLFIRGNREQYMLNHDKNKNDGWSYSSQTGSLLYTYEHLLPENFSFFADMQISQGFMLDEPSGLSFMACHGSPASEREAIEPDNEELMDSWLMRIKETVLLCGHTHKPHVRAIGNKTFVNPGSVGSPINGQTDAQYMLMTVKGGQAEFSLMNVSYDIEAVVAEFHKSGLMQKAPIWSRAVVRLLREGGNFPEDAVILARTLADKDGFDISGGIPEKYWERAADIINL